ncbi:hypothetical protein N7454_011113 [Penicillium verhagenii]|nr:hypothetical protein N7454_011113 [Penicillium verhagenii]
MEFRALARGLRARPSTRLFTPRIQHSNILTTLRYNSSSSGPQEPTIHQLSKQGSAKTPTDPSQSAQSTPEESTFNGILDELELQNANRPGSDRAPVRSKGIADAISGTMFPSAARDGVAGQLASRKTELKLGPTLGRQIHVEPERGVDLPAAIRMLEVTCSSNQIKQQSIQQKFHVRKGMKRKELRRSRWRKLFKFSFNETVKKIQRMQAQGW